MNKRNEKRKREKPKWGGGNECLAVAERERDKTLLHGNVIESCFTYECRRTHRWNDNNILCRVRSSCMAAPVSLNRIVNSSLFPPFSNSAPVSLSPGCVITLLTTSLSHIVYYYIWKMLKSAQKGPSGTLKLKFNKRRLLQWQCNSFLPVWRYKQIISLTK